MRLVEIMAAALSKTAIFEMAYERKKAHDIITGMQQPIAEHLIKIFAFDDRARQHWIAEVSGFFSKTRDIRLKPNAKRLPARDYYNLLWDEPLNNGVEFITSSIRQLQRYDYSDCKRSTLSDSEIYEQLEKLLHTISYDLASGRFEDFRDYVS